MGEFGARTNRALSGDNPHPTGEKVRAGESAAVPRAPVVKPPVRIHLRWIEDERFDVGRADGPRTLIDGNSKAAPGPVETLVGALAACSSVDVISILNKRRTPPAALEVNAVALRAQQIPARLTSVVLSFHVWGPNIDRAGLERAIMLSITKYCSVRDSLAPDIPVEWTLELNGETSSGTIPAEAPPAPAQ